MEEIEHGNKKVTTLPFSSRISGKKSYWKRS